MSFSAASRCSGWIPTRSGATGFADSFSLVAVLAIFTPAQSVDFVHRPLSGLARSGKAGPRSFSLLLSAAKDRGPLERTLDFLQIVRQAAYLLIEPTDVSIRARERRAHILEPSPQVPFPKPERDDLDLVTRVGPR